MLGRWDSYGVSVIQILNLFLFTLAYTITGGVAMKTIANKACEVSGPQGKDLGRGGL